MFPVEHLNFSSDRSEANLYTINLLALQVQTSYLLATCFAVSKIDKLLESQALVVSKSHCQLIVNKLNTQSIRRVPLLINQHIYVDSSVRYQLISFLNVFQLFIYPLRLLMSICLSSYQIKCLPEIRLPILRREA